MMINHHPFYFSQHIGGALLPPPPTGDSALHQSRSIFQVAEPSVFRPAVCEKEKAAVEGRSLTYNNVSLPPESPAPCEMREEGKKGREHKSTTVLVSTTSGNHPSTAVPLSTSFEPKLGRNMDRGRQEEHRSVDYQQSCLFQQQYDQQHRAPPQDAGQCERSSNIKLYERTSSQTMDHQQPIAADGESAAGEKHAATATTRPSSPPNMQQTTIERGQAAHPSEQHHPVVAAPMNISALAATDEPSASALNEEHLRAQLAQRDQEIADIMDRCVCDGEVKTDHYLFPCYKPPSSFAMLTTCQ